MPTCRRHYPGGNAGGAKVVPPVSSRLRPSPSLCWVGYHITRFEACSAFTHVTACLLAESLKRPFPSKASTVSLPPLPLRLLPAGTTSCRVGFAPTEKSRLGTAHKGVGYDCRNGPKGASHNGTRPLFRIGPKVLTHHIERANATNDQPKPTPSLLRPSVRNAVAGMGHVGRA